MYHKTVLKFKWEVELTMRDVDDIEGECIKTIVKDVLMSMSFPSE